MKNIKKIILLLAIVNIAACGRPLTITGKTDRQATTSGTLGSLKANNQLPEGTMDTTNRRKANTNNKQ